MGWRTEEKLETFSEDREYFNSSSINRGRVEIMTFWPLRKFVIYKECFAFQ